MTCSHCNGAGFVPGVTAHLGRIAESGEEMIACPVCNPKGVDAACDLSCAASQRDGVVCADEECDIASGIRVRP